MFLPTPAAAVAILDAAGVPFKPGEEALRPARLLVLFRSDLRLRHLSLDLLRTRPGWDEAFAHTIADLEHAGLRPEDLDGHAGRMSPEEGARLRDVAVIWQAVDRSADRSWTGARIYLEAARLLERRPELWPFPGATLATVSGHTGGAEARFVRAIPDVTLALLAGRPLRPHFVGRMRALLGDAAAEALVAANAPRRSASERDILASYLFEPPAVLADPTRPRSAGPDGTVDLEEHAGVEAEVEAASDWVARQIVDGVPLEDIAVLVPALEPLAGLVAERLARLPWLAPDDTGTNGTSTNGHLPVHVAGGLPLTNTAAGARALAVVRALRTYLAGDALAEVLPALRTTSPDGRHLAHGAAMDLVWSLGTAGGNPARPQGALEWAIRATDREPELEAQFAQAREAAGDPEQAGLARRARDLERLLRDLRAIRPALLALVDVARLAIGGASLAVLWPALRDFLAQWLLQPGEGARVHALLDERLADVVADGACGGLTGDDALRALEEVARSMRLPVGRFGEPAVYVGSLDGAGGLRFRAVRVIGLAEGHLPAVPRENPVIPDVVRARLGVPADGGTVTPPTAADRALEALHALDRVVRDAEFRVALSAPHLDVERSLREPSSVILEAAAALGRPNAATGERGPVIPDAVALRRDAFLPARRAAREFRRLTPIGESAWQDGVATRGLGLPAPWRSSPALDLERVTRLRGPSDAGPLDGILGAGVAAIAVPGLDPEWPISPSALQTLLQCPYLFLLGNVLGFEEPASAPSQREIGQPAYGGLVHRVAEEFYRVHGERFCARDDTLDAWRARADETIERVFDEFLRAYPLVGNAVRDQQRERLRHDVHELLEYDWSGGAPRRFVAVERAFGRPAPVALPGGRRVLHVRGQIDRLDVEAGAALVRDLKTGRPHPRTGKEREPNPVLDVQIAVYGLVARQLATAWHIPARIAAAYAYVGRGADERSWRKDFDQVLEPAAREWLDIAADLLTERSFPRTPDAADCTYCRFRPVCGDDVYERAARVLGSATGALARFRALKGAPPEAED
ncbi:MAG: PD-(D/E)XK nuclease family protein [Burkholderiales bacterium]